MKPYVYVSSMRVVVSPWLGSSFRESIKSAFIGPKMPSDVAEKISTTFENVSLTMKVAGKTDGGVQVYVDKTLMGEIPRDCRDDFVSHFLRSAGDVLGDAVNSVIAEIWADDSPTDTLEVVFKPDGGAEVVVESGVATDVNATTKCSACTGQCDICAHAPTCETAKHEQFMRDLQMEQSEGPGGGCATSGAGDVCERCPSDFCDPPPRCPARANSENGSRDPGEPDDLSYAGLPEGFGVGG